MNRKWRTIIFISAILFISGCFSITKEPMLSYAMPVSEDEMEKAFLEEFGAIEDSEDADILADEYYDQDIDEFIQQYMDGIEEIGIDSESFQAEKIVNPSLSMSFTEQGRIRYTLPNGAYYDVNVPNGMITSEAVIFEPQKEAIGVVEKNGVSSNLFHNWQFKEPGNYRVTLLFYHLLSEETGKYSVYEVNHHFTIVGKEAGDFGAVPAPYGFEIISAKKDGTAQPVEYPECFFLDGDGLFEIRYQDTKSGSFYISTTFNRDTTAPFLTFSKEIVDGKTEGPVEFYTSDIMDRVYITYNGIGGDAVGNVLSTPGNYGLTVSDEVGNSRTYQFEIQQTYHLLNTKVIILALLLIAAMGIRMILARRDMRVI